MPDNPTILFVGLGGSGKTSIHQVITHRLPPHETAFLSATKVPEFMDIQVSSFLRCTVVDMPGSYTFDKPGDENFFKKAQIFVIVIDMQETSDFDAVQYAGLLLEKAETFNPKLLVQVFLHKMDFDPEQEDKQFRQMRMHQRVSSKLQHDSVLHFYPTSIYDGSAHSAFSRVLQSLYTHTSYVEALSESFFRSCNIEKLMLIDVVTKLYISCDQQNTDIQFYELLVDALDVVVDINSVNGSFSENVETRLCEQAATLRPLKAIEDDEFVFGDYPALQPPKIDKLPVKAVIKTSSEKVIYCSVYHGFLAIMIIIKEENFFNQPFMDYNVSLFSEGLELLHLNSDIDENESV